MKELIRTVYRGEGNGEMTLDWIVRNDGNEAAGVRLYDPLLVGARMEESHCLVAVDTASGIAVLGTIAPGSVIHASVRVFVPNRRETDAPYVEFLRKKREGNA